MPFQGFPRRDGRLFAEGVPLERIAHETGTPTYVYSAKGIRANYRAYDQALGDLPHEIHYAVKANSSLGVLSLLAAEGAGFDIVSGGELYRVIQAGGDPLRVVFSGAGKTESEIRFALEAKIGSFNAESEAELELITHCARNIKHDLDQDRGPEWTPRAALRVNPDVNAETHPYIATGLKAHKFGVDIEQAERIYRRAKDFAPLELDGVSCHIGSQIFDTGAFLDALEKVLELVDRLRAGGVEIKRLDLGGGLGVVYRDGEQPPSIPEYGARLREALKGRDLELQLEPGRSIVGPAGLLLTQALYLKQNGDKNFLIVDAAMNDLIRPALYQAEHEIAAVLHADRAPMTVDVVGPICESGDFLAKDREMPEVHPGELIAVATAGAYGFVQASNYNSRPRAAEVLVDGSEYRVIRERESYEDLVRGETV